MQSAGPLNKCHCTDSIRSMINAGVMLETQRTDNERVHTVVPFESTQSFRNVGCLAQGCTDYLKNMYKEAKTPGAKHITDCMCGAGELFGQAMASVGTSWAMEDQWQGYWTTVCSVPSCYDYVKEVSNMKIMDIGLVFYEGQEINPAPFPDMCKEAVDPRAETSTATAPYKLVQQLKLDGDVSSFDVAAFRVKATKLYRVASAESISVGVSAGSVSLDITVKYESKAAAILASTTVSRMKLKEVGAILGITVLSKSSATTFEDKGPLFNEYGSLKSWISATLYSIALVVGLLICIYLIRRRRRNRKAKSKDATKQPTAVTSQATKQPTAVTSQVSV